MANTACCLVTKICKWSTLSRAGRRANQLCCHNRQQTSCIPETCTHTSFTVQVCAVHLQSMHAQLALYSFPPTDFFRGCFQLLEPSNPNPSSLGLLGVKTAPTWEGCHYGSLHCGTHTSSTTNFNITCFCHN